MRVLSLSILFCIFSLSFSFANKVEISALIAKGNNFFKEKKYSEALSTYRQIEAAGYTSADLFYNIGTSYYKVDSLGLASLYLHRALKLNPSDEDIEFNLQLVNTRTIDKLEAFPVFFLLTWWNSFLAIFHPDSWAIFAIASVFIACIFLMFYWFSSSPKRRGFFLMFFIIQTGISLLIFLIAFGAHRKNSQQNNFVVTAPTADIFSAPTVNSTRLFLIHEGAAGEIIEVQDQWMNVKFPNGNKGWIKATFAGRY